MFDENKTNNSKKYVRLLVFFIFLFIVVIVAINKNKLPKIRHTKL